MTPHAADVAGWQLFADMAPEAVEVVLSACERRLLTAGEVVVSEGDGGDALSIVRGGRIEVFTTIRGDVDRVLESFTAGEVLGAMGFVDGSRQAAGARAAEATELAVLTRAAFERVRGERPDVAAPFYRNLAAILASHLRMTLELYREAVELGIEATGAGALSPATLVDGLRPATVHLVGGASLAGRLLQLDKNPAGFTLVLKDVAGRLTVIPYHAIVRIDLTVP